jgi:hypothetical protein
MDPALFDPPAAAIELDGCWEKAVPPSLPGRGIMLPYFDLEGAAWLNVWSVVDAKGKLQDLRVLRSAEKDSHAKALNPLRSWGFNPGTCDGKPMPMPRTMEIPSTLR